MPGFICQGGDLTHDAQGRGGYSIYGERFADEGFKIKHTGEGQLLMANFGEANNNHSQFAVALAKIKELETGYVVFGRVLEGMPVLRAMEFEGSGDGVTARPIIIEECGEMDAAGQPIEELLRDDDDGGAAQAVAGASLQG